MLKWYRYAPFWPQVASKSFGHASALAAFCIGAATFLPMNTQVARCEDNSSESQAAEESVLVATRDAAPSDSSTPLDEAEHSEGDALAPVAQSSDNAPDLAAANEEDGQKRQNDTPRAAKNRRAARRAARTPTSLGFASLKQMGRRTTAKGNVPLEPVAFQGMVVGQSTKKDLLQEWGDPADTVATAEGSVFAFDIDPFQAVEVLVGDDDVIAAIKIALASPLDPEQLAEQLSLSGIRTVTAFDEVDQPLGLGFPERGVIFMYADEESETSASDGESANAVSHVVLQRLDPLAFAMRAEMGLHGAYALNINDLKTAIRLDPRCAHAHSLLAKIYLATGQANLADEAASSACEIDPNNASYQLIRGRTLELRGEYDDSVLTVRAVLDREIIAPVDKAQALHQMGCLASLGDVEIASKAIGFHTRAIEIADTLATSTIAKERRAAKQLLVEAHLAVAEEIARQAFQDKVENLGLWISRASGIAEEFITHDEGSIELRLLIAQRALAALGSFRPTLDPGPWVEEADEAARTLFKRSDDDLWQAHVQWELGLAYLSALRVEHVRRETESALQYGNRAVDYLAQGAKTRQAVHSSEQLIGQLYFQMGAVQAVHQLDHEKAAEWYAKAEPLLTGPLPKSELFAPRREGEMLVSMGVTYWQLGDKNRALTLTQHGVGRVEAAVKAGILARSTLGVPYGNLATMYEKLGESSNASKYSELARSVTGQGDPQSVGQAPEIRQTSVGAKSSAQRPRSSAPR
jgi:tetratricopeptide (TPR) repeat protein